LFPQSGRPAGCPGAQSPCLSESPMTDQDTKPPTGKIIVSGVDEEPESNVRVLGRWDGYFFFAFCVLYTAFHLTVLNVFPMETWAFRILHVAGGLMIGFGLAISLVPRFDDQVRTLWRSAQLLPLLVASLTALYAVAAIVAAFFMREVLEIRFPPPWVFKAFGPILMVSVVVATLSSWLFRPDRHGVPWYDWVLFSGSLSVGGY
ncbi:hypothetical protein RZS08_11725, partial [Arthrospira platensis SPKY1]|nr:hypothetical protein [Arthrospira platensis SPKY1]